MIRRTLFLGLTLFLVVVLVALIIRSQNRDRLGAEESAARFSQPAPTPIRVFAPEDVQARILRTEFGGGDSARHEIELRNAGTVTYDQFRVTIRYYEGNGKELAKRELTLRKRLGPGATERVEDIQIEGVPSMAVRQDVEVVSAEMSSETEK